MSHGHSVAIAAPDESAATVSAQLSKLHKCRGPNSNIITQEAGTSAYVASCCRFKGPLRLTHGVSAAASQCKTEQKNFNHCCTRRQPLTGTLCQPLEAPPHFGPVAGARGAGAEDDGAGFDVLIMT